MSLPFWSFGICASLDILTWNCVMIFNVRPCTNKQVNKCLFCDHALPLTFAHISSFYVFQLSWSFPLSFLSPWLVLEIPMIQNSRYCLTEVITLPFATWWGPYIDVYWLAERVRMINLYDTESINRSTREEEISHGNLISAIVIMVNLLWLNLY